MSTTDQTQLTRLQLARTPKAKKLPQPIAKVSAKKAAQLKQEKAEGIPDALQKWFEARRLEMSGVCTLCGGKTEKHNDQTYKHSIHHLLDKRPTMFPSVATHEDNFLEVCFYGNSCHTNLHNGTITWELLRDSEEWFIILDKLKKVYPFIAPGERKNLPEFLIKELESNK